MPGEEFVFPLGLDRSGHREGLKAGQDAIPIHVEAGAVIVEEQRPGSRQVIRFQSADPVAFGRHHDPSVPAGRTPPA